MARTSSLGKLTLALIGLTAVALLSGGCSKSVTVAVNLVDGFEIPSLGGIVAGEPIPEDLNIPALPVCAPLPSRSDLQGLLKNALGPILGAILSVDAVELVDTTLTATEGSFSDITFFGMYWQPSPVQGVTQPQVDFGYAGSTLGLASPLVLAPSQPVDFLTLLDNEAGNTSGECPELGVKIRGTVPSPEDMPSISMTLHLKITGSLGL